MKIQFSSFNNLFNTKNINQNRFYGISCPNLAPLKKDTVSFSARSELVARDMSTAPSISDCQKTEINAEPAAYYLEKVLEHYLKPLTVKPKGKGAEKPLDAELTTRIKSQTSIREKVVSKHAKLYKKEYKAFIASFLSELSNNFALNKNITEEDVRSFLYQTIKHDNSDTKYSPYANVPYLVSQLLEYLNETQVIDISDFNLDEYRAIYREMVDRIESSHKSSMLDDSGVYIKPSSIAGIKHYANDIVGSRIILEDSNPRYITLVLDALKNAVNDGLLKITSIENNIPDARKLPQGATIDDYSYASNEQLEEFAQATGAELDTNITKTGYIAIHINVDLSDEMFKAYSGVFNGFSGEIQIMGRDVERLKDVEDLCYKLKDNKNAYKSVYEPFKKHFKPLYDLHKDDFDEYTYRLYLAQRANSKKKRTSFPTPAELGFTEAQIPPQLDFNRLAIKKLDCDHDKKAKEKQNQTSKNSKYSLYTAGNIMTLKTIIRDKIFKQAH